MPRLKLVRSSRRRTTRTGFTLVYGLRLFPGREVGTLTSGKVGFARGGEGRITLHVLDGTREQIREQLLRSIDAFFDIHETDAPA